MQLRTMMHIVNIVMLAQKDTIDLKKEERECISHHKLAMQHDHVKKWVNIPMFPVRKHVFS